MRALIASVAAAVLLLMVPTVAGAGEHPPFGVDHLRGRWDVAAQDGENTIDLRMFVRDIVPGAEVGTYVAAGCMTTLESGGSAPLAVQATATSPSTYDVIIYSSIVPVADPPYIVRFDGVVDTGDGKGKPSVVDDAAWGTWTFGEGDMQWSGVHHDRRRPKCPGVELSDEGGFFFGADLYTASDQADNATGTIYESFTNIVSGAVRVDLPGGGSLVLPGFTDLFSPTVDFVTDFRYLDGTGGTPAAGEPHVFRLLDVLGNPIPGAVFTDYWLACLQGAPSTLSGTQPGGAAMPALVTWDPVAPVAGFDPSSGGPGFYQIEMGPDDPAPGDGFYGAGGMLATTHYIPWTSFAPGSVGSPDGSDFGQPLADFTEGTYRLDVIAFAESPAGQPGTGLECQVRDSNESLIMTKAGYTVTFAPVAGP